MISVTHSKGVAQSSTSKWSRLVTWRRLASQRCMCNLHTMLVQPLPREKITAESLQKIKPFLIVDAIKKKKRRIKHPLSIYSFMGAPLEKFPSTSCPADKGSTRQEVKGKSATGTQTEIKCHLSVGLPLLTEDNYMYFCLCCCRSVPLTSCLNQDRKNRELVRKIRSLEDVTSALNHRLLQVLLYLVGDDLKQKLGSCSSSSEQESNKNK